MPTTPPRPLADAVEYARRSREGLLAGLTDARAARLVPPAAEEHARRFLYGFTLPLTLTRIAWANPSTRRTIVDRLLPPLLFIALVGGMGVWWTLEDAASPKAVPEEPAGLSFHLGDDDDDKNDPNDEASRARARTALEAAKARRAEGASVLEASSAALATLAIARGAAPPRPPAPASRPGRLAALGAYFGTVWSNLLELFAALSVLEWILVWIGREHHDLIAYETSVLTGVPGEPLARPPRLRFDLGWLKLKSWRALRMLVFVALIGPVAWVAGRVPMVGAWLALGVGAAWAAYWACVFAIANTFVAWEPRPGSDGAPWFIRALDAVARIPVLGLPFRLYERLLARVTRGVWPACLSFERATWESAGLALVRALASFPGLYVSSRAMFAPAATHALLARTLPAPPSGSPGVAPELHPGHR